MYSAFEVLDVRPYQLMCIVCRLGSDQTGAYHNAGRLDGILNAVRGNPNIPLRLRCNVDSVYAYQNPGRAEDTPESELFNEKRDLDILRALGLVPGSTRPALELFERLLKKIATTRGICGYDRVTGEAWRGCVLASSGNYERGHKAGLGAVIPTRPEGEMARVKEESVRKIYEASVLHIRPHHLMCVACFHGGTGEHAPLKEDNIFEVLETIRENPEIPIKLVSGCCMVCPPCPYYDSKSNLCVGANGRSLRDHKKDLDVLQRLGLRFGDMLPAGDMYTRLFQAVKSARDICGYSDGVVTGWEWSTCISSDSPDPYERARAVGMGFLPPVDKSARP